MTALTLRVYGDPAPQGSKSAAPKSGAVCPACKRRRLVFRSRPCGVCHSAPVEILMRESSKAVAPWRQAVMDAARVAMLTRDQLDGPLVVSMVFTLPRPLAHFGTGRNAGSLRRSAPDWPAGYPDVAKLARSTEDALTMAKVWADDARVVWYDRLAKVYEQPTVNAGLITFGWDPVPLDMPGASILVRPVR